MTGNNQDPHPGNHPGRGTKPHPGNPPKSDRIPAGSPPAYRKGQTLRDVQKRGLEDKLNAYGNGFYGLYEENLELCSVVSYPDRGPWGDPKYRGNCSGWLAKDLILRFKVQSVFDPAEGSGTIQRCGSWNQPS